MVTCVWRLRLWHLLWLMAVLALLLRLGFWQLERAHYKQELRTTFADQIAEPAVPIEALEGQWQRYRLVRVRGQYDPRYVFALMNQRHEGRHGVHVYAPFRLDDGSALLVNRGWLSLQPGEALPLQALRVEAQPQIVLGRLSLPANPGMRLGELKSGHWPQLLQHIDHTALAAEWGYPLRRGVLLLEPQSVPDDDLLRNWQPDFGPVGPPRHHAYAVQWFALAAAWLVLNIAYLGLRRRADMSGDK